MLTQHIGFIGAGQMARALARGMIEAKLLSPKQISACDCYAEAIAQFTEQIPGSVGAKSNSELVEKADVVFLSVKPQNMNDVLAELRPTATTRMLFISIAAGFPLSKIVESLGQERVIRVMPNTPALVGRGASAYALGPGASSEDGELAQQLLSAVGIAFELKESLLDAVTGLSGSGPAYVYTMIEALSDGGVRMGLPRDVATQLAAQTVLGAAEMVTSSSLHPAILKDRVASPGGTTIAGMQTLEDHGFRAALIAAVEAATERSRELGRG